MIWVWVVQEGRIVVVKVEEGGRVDDGGIGRERATGDGG